MGARLQTRSAAASRFSGASVVACVLGVLAFLLLPALHSVHVAASHTGRGAHVHVHGGHVHEHEGDAPAETPHDSDSCDVCRVYFATTSGTDIPAAVTPVLPMVRGSGVVLISVDAPVVATASPDRPLRGPPC